MELDNAASAEDNIPSSPGVQTEATDDSPDKNKGKLTTVASTYFNERIAVPDAGGVCNFLKNYIDV